MDLDALIKIAELLANVGGAVGGAVLFLIGIGFKFGRRESRNPPSIRPAAAAEEQPTTGELGRRVAALENDRRQYLRAGEFTEFKEANRSEHEAMRGDIKDLRIMDSAQQRRIDALVGQG